MKRALLLVVLIAGCSSRPVEPVVRVVETKVPVPVVREASAELKDCGKDLPWPTFVPATDASGAALVGLAQPEREKTLQLIAGLHGCVHAWRVWADE